MPVDTFKARVAQLALAAAASEGFALAGGNALAAHGLLSRPTQDVDLFSPQPGGAVRVLPAVRAALEADGFDVQVTRGSADEGAEFAQLHVSRDGQTTQLDLGRDWRAHEAVALDIGPVLHLDDAVGAKVTALIGRGLARDYIDVAAALTRYPPGGSSSWLSSETQACESSTWRSPHNGWINFRTTSSHGTTSTPHR